MHILRRRRPAAKSRTARTYQTVRLAPGRHRGPDDDVCVMELASMLAGEPFTDYPKSVCPTVSALLRAYNDALGSDERQDLFRYASASVGTRAGTELQERRAQFALAWAKSREYGRPRRWWSLARHKAPQRRESSPGDIADYVVASLGRRPAASSHAAMLGLLDWLIAMNQTEGGGEPAPGYAPSTELSRRSSASASTSRTGPCSKRSTRAARKPSITSRLA